MTAHWHSSHYSAELLFMWLFLLVSSEFWYRQSHYLLRKNIYFFSCNEYGFYNPLPYSSKQNLWQNRGWESRHHCFVTDLGKWLLFFFKILCWWNAFLNIDCYVETVFIISRFSKSCCCFQSLRSLAFSFLSGAGLCVFPLSLVAELWNYLMHHWRANLDFPG